MPGIWGVRRRSRPGLPGAFPTAVHLCPRPFQASELPGSRYLLCFRTASVSPYVRCYLVFCFFEVIVGLLKRNVVVVVFVIAFGFPEFTDGRELVVVERFREQVR